MIAIQKQVRGGFSQRHIGCQPCSVVRRWKLVLSDVENH